MAVTMIICGTVVTVTAMVCLAADRIWRGWLEIKRLELAARPQTGDEVGLRIELAAVKERLKKLEAIASGVEL